MAKIVSFTNQKGGVGKTTTAIHVAAAIALKGKKVLIIDLDPQGNLASGVGISKSSIKKSIYDVLINQTKASEAILPTNTKNLDILPSTLSLVGLEHDLSTANGRNLRLKSALEEIKDQYDYIFIDCPPSLGLMTVNALAASNAVIIPMTCEFFALEGLSQVRLSIKKVKEQYNPDLFLAGIVLTMYNRRLTLTKQVEEEIKKYFGDKLFKATVSRSVRIAEAPSYGKTVYKTAPLSASTREYKAVANELLLRL